MGLISNYFNKPGPGVSKDASQQKHSFFLFFDIYWRKLGALIRLNLLYFITVIWFYIPVILIIMAHGNSWNIIFLLSFLPIGLTGPATAGLTFVLRNYAREEHAFILSDYVDTIKHEWKQSLACSMIFVSGSILLAFVISFYFHAASVNKLFLVPLTISMVIALMFLFVQYYIYPLLVTFRLSFKQLCWNAVSFSIIGLGRNLLILLFSVLVVVLSTFHILAFLLIPLLSLSTIGLIINFNVWPLLKRYLIDANPDLAKTQKDVDVIFVDRGKEK